MQEVIKIALDNNDLRHQIAAHDRRLTAHDSRITVVEVAMVDNSSDIKEILKRVENSLTLADQKKILSYLEKFETNKDKAIRYYIIGSTVILAAVAVGFPLKEVFYWLAKTIIKAVV